MKTKKYKHADLEKKRSIFFQIGIIISLACVFVAFEWSSSESGLSIVENDEIWDDPEEMMPITREVEKPKPIKPIQPEVLIITDDPTVTDVIPDIISEPEDINCAIELPPMVEEVEDNKVFVRVERMPEFPGGDAALLKFIASNVKYPVICAEIGVQGRVYVAFVVSKDGSVTDVQVVRSPDANLSAEALRVVKMMPKWKPGKQGGKPVNVSYNIPVNFRLQ
ncbi:energy transducer TonB [Carboxylicivirga sp. N1Y90]|uniref:energy transducer TonB n=1 Tax=Carboxylicivirga fragile TaxID=3417571 RepID=UPI003D356A96|nr:TonB family protein [Marinilabiliaceae bacterium N1Y90]